MHEQEVNMEDHTVIGNSEEIQQNGEVGESLDDDKPEHVAKPVSVDLQTEQKSPKSPGKTQDE